MSRRSFAFAAIIMSPVRWHVANSVRGGFIFDVCNLRRGEIFGEKGLCVPFLLGVKSPGVVEGD